MSEEIDHLNQGRERAPALDQGDRPQQDLASRSFNAPFASPEEYEGLIRIWQSVRASIATFDTLVMTLLTQGTILVFAAFGVVFGNARALGPVVSTSLSIGLFFGILMLFVGLWRYTSSIRNAVKSAQSIEDKLFGTDEDDPRRISNILAKHPLAAKRGGLLYYRIWAGALVLASLAAVVWQLGIVPYGDVPGFVDVHDKIGEYVTLHLTRSEPQNTRKVPRAQRSDSLPLSIMGTLSGVSSEWIIIVTQEHDLAIPKDKIMMIEFGHGGALPGHMSQ